MNIVLISTYELGRQPFGLASPAAWLRATDAKVTCQDLAVQNLARGPIEDADLVAFFVPMHTATRIAAAGVEQIRKINPNVHLCFYGLYAPMNEGYLRKLGADTILGGEFEEGLVALANRLKTQKGSTQQNLQQEPVTSLSRQKFLVPDRSGLPNLDLYAHLQTGPAEQRVVGYTESSRGCKHLCRHCPIVPVYGGRFRVVQQEVVLEDIKNQVAAGARHITFGDPDFFNGPTHSVQIVKALHERWPDLTYDVTIKIQHLLENPQAVAVLRDTGCLIITSAVESVDNYILEIFDKNHTKEDFIRAVSLLRQVGLTFNPTFVTFTPWTSLQGYLDLLETIDELDIVDNVAPVQYAVRLLIPEGSKLLELPIVQELVGKFDEEALCYRWTHPDPRVDQLYEDVLHLVKESRSNEETRRVLFGRVWDLAHDLVEGTLPDGPKTLELSHGPPRAPIPFLTEDWFC